VATALAEILTAQDTNVSSDTATSKTIKRIAIEDPRPDEYHLMPRTVEPVITHPKGHMPGYPQITGETKAIDINRPLPSNLRLFDFSTNPIKSQGELFSRSQLETPIIHHDFLTHDERIRLAKRPSKKT
jgi:hypothetical protein